MCGRFGLSDKHPAMMNAFDVVTDLQRDVDWETVMPRYNVAPTDQIPVILDNGGQRCLEPMRWGLIPIYTACMRGRTALDWRGKSINTPINARAETVHSQSHFRESFKKRRCLIPAGGFYEWKREGQVKHPYWIYLKDRSWMGFAGLYNWWKSPEDQWVLSCTIITTVSNRFIEPIHARMPVILTEGTYDLWLDPENLDLSELKEVLVPYPTDKMRAHPVPRLVNRAENDGPELIEPRSNEI